LTTLQRRNERDILRDILNWPHLAECLDPPLAVVAIIDEGIRFVLFAILLCVSYRARWHIEQISGFQIVIRTRSNPTTNCNRHVHSINLGLTHIRFCIGYKLTQTYSQRRKLDHICKYFYINQLEIYTPKHIPLTYSPDASPSNMEINMEINGTTFCAAQRDCHVCHRPFSSP